MSAESKPEAAVDDLAASWPAGGRLHLVGIGGIGMSALARHLVAAGFRVSGSDACASPLLDGLTAEGIEVRIGHAARNVPRGCAAVIATAAVPDDNAELAAARRRKLAIDRYAQALGRLGAGRETVAVAGTHGKTTVGAMLAFLLERAGLEPGAVIGGLVPQLGGNALLGEGAPFVVEACEYARSFLELSPRHAIVTNVGDDHLDYYGSLDHLRSAFRSFAGLLPSGGLLVTSARVARDLDLRGVCPGEIFTLGNKRHDVRLQHREDGFVLQFPDGRRGTLPGCGLPGGHNRQNAAMAVIMAHRAFGLSLDEIAGHLESFEGVERRFRVLSEDVRRAVVDDYAHHPTEIEATLLAARERFPGRRLIAVFQPHLEARVRRHFSAFLNALAYADDIELVRDYRVVGRDDEGRGGARALLDAFASLGLKVGYHDAVDRAAEELARRPARGEVVCVMGAGDVGRVSDELARSLR